MCFRAMCLLAALMCCSLNISGDEMFTSLSFLGTHPPSPDLNDNNKDTNDHEKDLIKKEEMFIDDGHKKQFRSKSSTV